MSVQASGDVNLTIISTVKGRSNFVNGPHVNLFHRSLSPALPRSALGNSHLRLRLRLWLRLPTAGSGSGSGGRDDDAPCRDAQVELSLQVATIPRPEKDQILVRVEASPINPSDLGGFLAGMDKESAFAEVDNAGNPIIRGRMPEERFKAMAARDGIPLPIGNEGAGVVSAVGLDSCEEAQKLLGQTVAILGPVFPSLFL